MPSRISTLTLVMQIIYYPVNEVFTSLQGEGMFTGTPSTFIRLQGCDVGCSWCDTKHTWKLNKRHEHDNEAIRLKSQISTKTWSSIELASLLEIIQTDHNTTKHLVITGGEPTLYDLQPLCHKLALMGKFVQIETSGTSEIKVTPDTWVTLSPKIGKIYKKKLLSSAVHRANEIKFPVQNESDIEQLKLLIQEYKNLKHLPIWLQPISAADEATKLCIDACLKNNWRLSIQTHKLLNIR